MARRALLAAVAVALLACAAAKEHRYQEGQEVSIWANKGTRRGRHWARRDGRRWAGHPTALVLQPWQQRQLCLRTQCCCPRAHSADTAAAPVPTAIAAVGPFANPT